MPLIWMSSCISNVVPMTSQRPLRLPLWHLLPLPLLQPRNPPARLPLRTPCSVPLLLNLQKMVSEHHLMKDSHWKMRQIEMRTRNRSSNLCSCKCCFTLCGKPVVLSSRFLIPLPLAGILDCITCWYSVRSISKFGSLQLVKRHWCESVRRWPDGTMILNESLREHLRRCGKRVLLLSR